MTESGVLTTKQKKDLTKLKFSESELEEMVVSIIVDMASRLARARVEYRKHEAEIRELKDPPLWNFRKSWKAPVDYKEEYLSRLRESRRELVKAQQGES